MLLRSAGCSCSGMHAMQLQQITRKRKGKKVTRFAAYLETLFGLSRDYGGPANIPQLQKHLLFQVLCID